VKVPIRVAITTTLGFDWKLGDPTPPLLSSYQNGSLDLMVTASGPELTSVIGTIWGLPHKPWNRHTDSVTVWRGEFARFIVDNFWSP
jgi:hypothetical protein